MKRIEASKLARGLGAVLEQVIAGERYEVVRYGRVVAVIGPPMKREGQPVRPEKLGFVQHDTTPIDAVSPPPRPGVGKVSPNERQRHVDDLLRGARNND